MLTCKEMTARCQSVNNLRHALSHATYGRSATAHKLYAFIVWFDPPVSIRDAINTYIKRLYAESDAAGELLDKAEKISERLYALPTVGTYTSCGEEYTLIHKGMLPDFEPTSTDEEEALQMLADYYARHTA